MRGRSPVFVSQQQYEFKLPPSLAGPDVQHWRMMELSLHAPWFILSVEVVDPDEPDHGVTRTLCIAWECDLAEFLRELEPTRVTGVVCMMPAWQSPNGQWWSREVREVWLYRSAGGQHVVLVDAAGQKFDCGLIPEHVGTAETKLLLRLIRSPSAG